MSFFDTEAGVRLTVFAGIFIAMAVWEVLGHCRTLRCSRKRWVTNLSVLGLDVLVQRLTLPISLVGFATMLDDNGWGLCNWLEAPQWLAVPLAVITLDLAVYLQHRFFHWVPWLWQVHMAHHADLDFDLTTGLRFHPIEILLSILWKLSVVLVVGASPLAVLLFELLLNGTAMFNHGNVSLPQRVEAVVRPLLVTPDMHRVHHSVERTEANSNFGFCLSWWDRLFATYRSESAAGNQAMRIGLSHLQSCEDQSLLWVLALPFRASGGGYERAATKTVTETKDHLPVHIEPKEREC